MEVVEFREKIKPGLTLRIKDKNLGVKEVIKFRFDDGSHYIKCFLSNDYVFADDLDENIFLLVKEVKTDFQIPFTEDINYKGKKFKFLYTAHAIAEETWGEEIFKRGDSERFWDFAADDGSYLSLGIIDRSSERLDFFGEIVAPKDVSLG